MLWSLFSFTSSMSNYESHKMVGVEENGVLHAYYSYYVSNHVTLKIKTMMVELTELVKRALFYSSSLSSGF